MFRVLALFAILAGPAASEPQDPGRALPGAPASPNIALELQVALTVAIERFQAMDRAGVLSNISNQYRTDSLTKPAIAGQLRVIFALDDRVRAQVHLAAITMARTEPAEKGTRA